MKIFDMNVLHGIHRVKITVGFCEIWFEFEIALINHIFVNSDFLSSVLQA